MPEHPPDEPDPATVPESRPLSEAEAAALLNGEEPAAAADMQPIILEEEAEASRVVRSGWRPPGAKERERLALRESARRTVRTPVLLLRLASYLNFAIVAFIFSVHVLDEFHLLGPTGLSPNPEASRIRSFVVYGLAGFSFVQAVCAFTAASGIRRFSSSGGTIVCLLVAMIPTGWAFIPALYFTFEFVFAVVPVAIVQAVVGGLAMRAMLRRDVVMVYYQDRGRDVGPETVADIRVNAWLKPSVIGLIAIAIVAAVAIAVFFGVFARPPAAALKSPRARAAYEFGMAVGLCIMVGWTSLTLVTGLFVRNRVARPMVLIGSVIVCLPMSLLWVVGLPFGVWTMVAMFDRDVTRAFLPARPKRR
ncbi:hypothetical protein [Limnoglobus roseus]|uniref:Uncharacterized protein n=1 Tax=Limnoglobus roseus TaxID=2598579 RepID=A0A5C1A7B5_9BACT|nr:hypothetical protein [Limnoglobus roseus]QEL15159.1 hypothetical protein PX52LOC_02069 [Limnoglobus roseus]